METQDFKLAGGGLVDRILPARFAESTWLCVAATIVTWLPLLVLGFVAGTALGTKVETPFLTDFTTYARFLVALPLLIVADSFINGRLSSVVSYLWNAEILVGDDRLRYQAAIRDVHCRRDSIIADVVILLIVGGVAWLGAATTMADGVSTWADYDRGSGGELTAAGWWYWLVSLPLLQFILLRWLWRMIIWWRFLWRLSRFNLRLLPTHPDRTGGLGILAMGQATFVILVFALATVLAGHLANGMLYDGLTLQGAIPTIVAYVVLSLLFILGPLLAFAGKLVLAKRRGLVVYGDLADDLFGAFDKKWTGISDAEQRKLLGDADPSSLSDFGYSYEIVSGMRIVPMNHGTWMSIVVLTLIPFVPLLLVQYSVKEIFQQLAGVLG